MRPFRSAVDFARSSSRECLRRCQRRGLFLPVSYGEAGGGDAEHTAQEIPEYRLFREFCEPTMQDASDPSWPIDSRNDFSRDSVRLRRSQSASCSDSLQQMHRRLQTTSNDATVPVANGCHAPSVKVRSQKVTSTIGRLSRKLRQCEVVLLDGTEATFSVEPSSKAQALLDLVCEFLSITERQYFGLCYKDPTIDAFQWLYNEKRLGKQLDAAAASWRLDFAVKFYPVRPECLSDASARSCMALQVRQSLVAGRLPCSAIGYALLGSYLMQSELGDRRIGDGGEVDDDPAFCPPEVLAEQPGVARLARRLHASHAGLASRDAERRLLANARRLAAYGLDVHSVRCVEGEGDGEDRKEVGEGDGEMLVGVCSDGLVLMRPVGLLRLARLTWPRVTALTRRGREVRITLRRLPMATVAMTEAATAATATVRLRCGNGRLAKRLWRSAVEHHGFFRLRSRDNSDRERIQCGTVRLSRSYCNGGGGGFSGGRTLSTFFATEDGNLERFTSLPWQRRAASMNRVGDAGTRPATLVTPEDIDDSACAGATAAGNNDKDDADDADDAVDDHLEDDALEIVAGEAGAKAVWHVVEDEETIEPSMLGRSAAECRATHSNIAHGIQSDSNAFISRFDSSSTDNYQEHEPRTASDLASGSPVSRQPPSGEETPSGQQDCDEDKRTFFHSPETVPTKTLQTAGNIQSIATLPVPDVEYPSRPSPVEPWCRRRLIATAAAAASSTAAVEEEINRVSIMETRTETTEINEPIEELVSYTDEHGNSVTRKVFRCRRIRRIITDTVVESPLSAWRLFCQDNHVDEATMSAVMEQLRLKRAHEASGRDEGYV